MTNPNARFLEWLDAQDLPRSELYECPYLPDRLARQFGFSTDSLGSELYQSLMDRGYRRSGTIFYGMDCPACQACVPLRIPVAAFAPSKSQRRTARKNLDVRVEFATPQFRSDSHQLYQRYLRQQHPDSPQSEGEESLREMLYSNVVDTLEARYLLGDRLIGVSMLDVTPQALSAVYHFFDPELRDRRIGVYSVLQEIAYAQRQDLPYYYLGYWVEHAKTMHYKANYRPHELLIAGTWQRR